MIFSLIAGLVGGLGLFLLGMRLMTKGLRNAAGNALRSILGKWTKTPLRGLASGFMITALVQPRQVRCQVAAFYDYSSHAHRK